MRFNIQKTHKNKSKISIILLVLAFIFVFKFIKKLEPGFWSGVEAYITYKTERIVNDAVIEIFDSENISYHDLVDLDAINSGEVSALRVNTVQMNILKSNLANKISEDIHEKENEEIVLKLGSIYKSPLFSGIGPDIRIKIHPENQTIIKFKDSFTQSGINQVKHTIYLDVTVNLTITTSISKKTSQFNTTIPVADTVIVGTVPKYYGNSGMNVIGE